MKRQSTALMLILLVAVLLSACGQSETTDEKWQETKTLYHTEVQNSGEDDPATFLEIAERSARLLPLLEKNVGAFVMDAYNYQSIDDKGTPMYTQNNVSDSAIDPYGQCIRVSPNYFVLNPIETAEGGDLTEQIVYDELTLNVLAPEKYRDREDELVALFREAFYYEKVQAANEYNQEAGLSDTVNTSIDSLQINVIYVKDGQKYFTYRTDCAADTGNWVEDPVVEIYTDNLHASYAHSFLTQWVYFSSEKTTALEAYGELWPYIQQCGAEDSIQRVVNVYAENVG